MRHTTTFCDICKEEIKPGYGVDTGSLKLKGRANKETSNVSVLTYSEICHTCTVKLFTLIKKMEKDLTAKA